MPRMHTYLAANPDGVALAEDANQYGHVEAPHRTVGASPAPIHEKCSSKRQLAIALESR